MVAAQDIIKKAHTALQDEDGTRWPAHELVAYLNMGQRQIIIDRPDQKCETTEFALAAGVKQIIPAAAMALMDVPNNSTGRMRRITKIDVVQLDAVLPEWRSKAQASEIVHFMHDLREPKVFRVYPPAIAGTKVDVTYSLYPVDVPIPSGQAASSVTGSIDLDDMWESALLNYVLHKAYSKDAEFGGNSQLAAGYLGLFNAAVGSQLQSTATVAPQT